MVAAARAVASKADHPLIDDRFAEPLVRAVGIEFFARWVSGDITAAEVDVAEDAWGLQRMVDLMGARTRYFDAFFTIRCRPASVKPSFWLRASTRVLIACPGPRERKYSKSISPG
jgi:hypothetical protein